MCGFPQCIWNNCSLSESLTTWPYISSVRATVSFMARLRSSELHISSCTERDHGHCSFERASNTRVIKSSPLKICIVFPHPPQSVFHDRNINVATNKAVIMAKVRLGKILHNHTTSQEPGRGIWITEPKMGHHKQTYYHHFHKCKALCPWQQPLATPINYGPWLAFTSSALLPSAGQVLKQMMIWVHGIGWALRRNWVITWCLLTWPWAWEAQIHQIQIIIASVSTEIMHWTILRCLVLVIQFSAYKIPVH